MHKIIFYKKLPQKLRTIFDQFIYESFDRGLSRGELKEDNDKFCSKKDRIGYVLTFKVNRIIGAVIILKRRIRFNGANLILGGVGGVSVHKKYRRQGIATAMLKIAMRNLKREKCDLVYLCTYIEKLKKLYSPAGFTALNRPHMFLGKSGKRYTEHDAMIAPVNSPEKFKAVLTDNKPFDIGRGNW